MMMPTSLAVQACPLCLSLSPPAWLALAPADKQGEGACVQGGMASQENCWVNGICLQINLARFPASSAWNQGA